MRRVLIDHARANRADRRGGRQEKQPLELVNAGVTCSYDNLLQIDEALTALEQSDPRAARVTELRFFCRLGGKGDRRAVGNCRDHGEARLEVRTCLAGEAARAGRRLVCTVSRIMIRMKSQHLKILTAPSGYGANLFGNSNRVKFRSVVCSSTPYRFPVEALVTVQFVPANGCNFDAAV